MKRTHFFYSLLIIVPLVVLFLFCAAWGIAEKRKWDYLHDIEEVSRVHPQHACELLERQPSLAEGWHFRRSMYALIYTESLLNAHRPIVSDSLISSSLIDFTDDDCLLKYRSLVAMARVQQRLGRFTIAKQYFQQARSTAVAVGDTSLLSQLDTLAAEDSRPIAPSRLSVDDTSYVRLLIKYQELQRQSHDQLLQGILSTLLFSSLIVAGFVAFFFYDRRNKRRAIAREQRFNAYVCRLQEEIAQLVTRQHMSSLTEDEQTRFEQLFSMSEIIRHIQHVSQQVNSHSIRQRAACVLSSSQLTELLHAFDLCHDSFVSRLRSHAPSLNDVDLSICCLLRMGVSTEAICLLIETNPEALRKRRYRIRKEKLQLTDMRTLERFLIDF